MNILILNKDLRLHDNSALWKAIDNKDQLYLAINLSKEVLKQDAIRSLDYFKAALINLNQEVKINIFNAKDEVAMIQEIQKQYKIDNIYLNYCFTPYSTKMMQKIKKHCLNTNTNYHFVFDYLVFPPETILSDNKKPFKVFSPFYQRALKKIKDLKVKGKPSFNALSFKGLNNQISIEDIKFKPFIDVPLTRKEVFRSILDLKNASRNQSLINPKSTSQISSAMAWGIVSAKEVALFAYHHTQDFAYDFLRQIIWRDFFYHYYYLDKEYTIDGNNSSNILKTFNKFKWIDSKDHPYFVAWKNGKTGIKIVDAIMNQLNQAGFINNRSRMIVSSFLTKDLNVHWKLGERYFAKQLLDYDPVINNQSWQWAAGCGLDFIGAFRVFAPEIQAKKFDPDNLFQDKYGNTEYVEPIVNPKETRKGWRERYKNNFID